MMNDRPPRFTIHWGSITTALAVAGIIAVFTMLFSIRDQVTILINKPEPATKDQLNYTNLRIDSLQMQINQMQQKMTEHK